MLVHRRGAAALGAIDVGTNAVRLKIARLSPDGSVRTLHQERDPIRPGAGVFDTGVVSEASLERLISTLKRYREASRSLHAHVRAVATSALREAANRDEVVERVREETGFDLEVISGREEARLIALGALWGTRGRRRSALIDIGGGSTEVALATGDRPTDVWSIGIGAVRLTELFSGRGRVDDEHLSLMRQYALRATEETFPEVPASLPGRAMGTSGSIRALVPFAAPRGGGEASLRQVHDAVRRLAALSHAERVKRFEPRRAEVIVAAAVILETVMRRLKIERVRAVEAGLRDGVLVDLYRRHALHEESALVESGALALGRRFGFDEDHARQVADLATRLFDDLEAAHGLPHESRVLLHVAALLHDVGYAVSRQKHHRHSAYLVEHADLVGLGDRERLVASRLTRFHRRRPPRKGHPGLDGLHDDEARVVRRLAPLLRLADALDRGHHQAIHDLTATVTPKTITVRLHAGRGAALELWDAEREAPLFQSVYGRRLRVVAEG